MAGPVRFLHLADVHIGFRVTRFDQDTCDRLREARFQSLDNAVKVAAEGNVDFIAICGDLFDDNSVSRSDSERAFNLLKGQRCPVLVVPGNHDPWHAGCVWERPPWSEAHGTAISVLAAREPHRVRDDVVVYPCPVQSRRAHEDPTAWIPSQEAAGGDDVTRIGMAHGCVMDRDNLPPDDHPIPENAASIRELDYLALGHWHRHREFPDGEGAIRMAYPGTSEQMAFPASSHGVGWEPYSSTPGLDELAGTEEGEALLVEIAAPGAPPKAARQPVGQFRWRDETVGIAGIGDFQQAFSEIARRDAPERCLLRVQLMGVAPAEVFSQLQSFQDMLTRYAYHDLDVTGLHVQPTDEEVEQIAGTGLLSDVLLELRRAAETEDRQEQQTAERALLLLYELAREVER